MVVPETPTPKKTKKKKTETTQTTTPITPPEAKPKEKAEEKAEKEAKREVKKEAKEIKPPTKEAKPPTTPTPKKKPNIRTTTWEKFEKFKSKGKETKKSWIKEAIERARKEPVEIRNLTRGQLIALITQVNKYNYDHEPKLAIKYDFRQGIALIAPLKQKT